MNIVDFKPEYLKHVDALSWVVSAFIARVEGVEVSTDKDETVKALEPTHFAVSDVLGFSEEKVFRAEQVHGAKVVEITSIEDSKMTKGVDGLMSKLPGVMLGIYVADCGAIYVVDTVERGVALLHSGKKGTEANILQTAIDEMQQQWGSKPENLRVLLAPCIRPPHYEIDFAATIKEQVIAAGVAEDHYLDCGICTGEQVEAFYSYRLEKGDTGRNLALLGVRK